MSTEEEEAQQGCGCLLFILLLVGGLYFYRSTVVNYVHQFVRFSNALDEQRAADQAAARHRTAGGASPRKDLTALYRFQGKYPHDVKLLTQPVIKKRLKSLLGRQYAYMRSIWELEAPIEVEHGQLYAWGMQAHSGGNPSAVLMADIEQNVLYVGICQNHQVTFYSENGEDAPAKMQQWASEDVEDADGRDL